jgi:DNA-binding SARP family transcriptional activator
MIRLSVLGTLRVATATTVEDSTLLGQPKLLALLLFLVVARPQGFHQRDRLLGLFWPELGQEQARAALRKALHRLRQSFGDEIIASAGQDAVSVPVHTRGCDVDDFETAVAAGRFGEALDHYRGELAPGLYVAGAPAFEQWLSGERARLQETAMTAAWQVVERLANASEFTNASRVARRVARLANGDERVVCKVMTMLARLGDRAGAVRVYRQFELQLWEELQMRPTATAAALMQGIAADGMAPS